MSCVSHAFTSVYCCLVVTCWESADPWLLLVMFIVCLLLSHVVSGVRCGTLLYRFLILPSFSLLQKRNSDPKIAFQSMVEKSKQSVIQHQKDFLKSSKECQRTVQSVISAL